jgi:hypothetical protein
MKTILVQILSVFTLVIAHGFGLPATALIWIGVASFTISAVLQLDIFSSGTMTRRFTVAQIIVLAGGVILQVVNYMGDHLLIDPSLVNYLVIGLTFIIQKFVKVYPANVTGK